jgi:hypothetical protein
MPDVFITLAIVFACSFLVETLVEAVVGEPINHIPKLLPFKWTIQYVAFGVGIAGAFIYQFDFLALLGRFLGDSTPITTFGTVLTGLAIGRGSVYIHDFIKKFFVRPNPIEG